VTRGCCGELAALGARVSGLFLLTGLSQLVLLDRPSRVRNFRTATTDLRGALPSTSRRRPDLCLAESIQPRRTRDESCTPKSLANGHKKIARRITAWENSIRRAVTFLSSRGRPASNISLREALQRGRQVYSQALLVPIAGNLASQLARYRQSGK
jgi:hypothetical protein